MAMNEAMEKDLEDLKAALRLLDPEGVFTRFLEALVDYGCPVETILRALRKCEMVGGNR